MNFLVPLVAGLLVGHVTNYIVDFFDFIPGYLKQTLLLLRQIRERELHIKLLTLPEQRYTYIGGSGHFFK